jgi:cbb3-type cytochrome oxidase subunit 3
MRTVFKIALIATLLVYSGGLAYTYYSNKQFQEAVAVFDLDKNGLIDKTEINKQSSNIARQQAKRKTTKQGALVLIPVSLIIGLFVFGIAFLFRKIKRTNETAIFYKNTNK